MTDKVISFAQWKADNPPILICWKHGIACALAWQELWLKVLYGTFSK